MNPVNQLPGTIDQGVIIRCSVILVCFTRVFLRIPHALISKVGISFFLTFTLPTKGRKRAKGIHRRPPSACIHHPSMHARKDLEVSTQFSKQG